MTRTTIWVPAYVGLGSNQSEPRSQLTTALDELAVLPATRLIAHSQLYQSPPMGPPDQPDFVNAVAGLLTTLSAAELFDRLLQLEQGHGRIRNESRWGPRTLDLDLLVYGDTALETDTITVPHPGIPHRSFVLYPLAEIAPELAIPGMGSVRDLLEQVSDKDLRVISDTIIKEGSG